MFDATGAQRLMGNRADSQWDSAGRLNAGSYTIEFRGNSSVGAGQIDFAFRLVNAAGDSTVVKFHWRPELGLQSTLWDEAVKIAGADPAVQRRAMLEAITSGGSADGEFAVHLFPAEHA